MSIKEVMTVHRYWKTGLFGIILAVLLPIFVSERASAYVSLNYLNEKTGFEEVLEDKAGLLNEKTADLDAIYEQLDIIGQYGNAALLTVSSNPDSAAQFAKEVYRDWFGTDSGILFLIDMDNRQLYLFSDGKIYKTINRAAALTITDNSYRYASKGEYEACILDVFTQIATKLEGGRIAQPMRYFSAFFLSILVALMLTFILAKKCNSTDLSDEQELMESIMIEQRLMNHKRTLIFQKLYVDDSSDSGGGSSGGGGDSSGGGGGHGF